MEVSHIWYMELIFCNDLKSNAKIPLTFYGENQGDADFLVGLQRRNPLTLLDNLLCFFGVFATLTERRMNNETL